jgi:hypothetical protein
LRLAVLSRASAKCSTSSSPASSTDHRRPAAISPKTVEVHRARVMEKMGVRSVAELVQAVMAGRHG